jgi:hypothetical protein
VVAEEKVSGLALQYQLRYPGVLLFVNLCGSNTSQTENEQAGGQ